MALYDQLNKRRSQIDVKMCKHSNDRTVTIPDVGTNQR